jgi:hypothetical protein
VCNNQVISPGIELYLWVRGLGDELEVTQVVEVLVLEGVHQQSVDGWGKAVPGYTGRDDLVLYTIEWPVPGLVWVGGGSRFVGVSSSSL